MNCSLTWQRFLHVGEPNRIGGRSEPFGPNRAQGPPDGWVSCMRGLATFAVAYPVYHKEQNKNKTWTVVRKIRNMASSSTG